MGHCAKSLLRNQLAGYTANPVGFIFYTDQSIFQLLNKLLLFSGQLTGLFFGKCIRAIFQYLEGIGCIIGAMLIRTV
jgi:hypothetical protein